MGFASAAEVEAFLATAPVFEKMLVDDGILLFKYWLCCDQDEQEERFAERRNDPLKGWKLSPIDVTAREKYDDYTAAREAMLRRRIPGTRRGRWSISTTRSSAADAACATARSRPDTTIEDPPVDLPPLSAEREATNAAWSKPLKPFRI
jgi:hypothetical protein